MIIVGEHSATRAKPVVFFILDLFYLHSNKPSVDFIFMTPNDYMSVERYNLWKICQCHFKSELSVRKICTDSEAIHTDKNAINTQGCMQRCGSVCCSSVNYSGRDFSPWKSTVNIWYSGCFGRVICRRYLLTAVCSSDAVSFSLRGICAICIRVLLLCTLWY